MKARTKAVDLSFDNYVEEAFPKIEKDMCEFTFSNGSFSLIDVIDYVLESSGTANIDISSWVASYASINHIIDFLEDQKLNKMRFLMDSGFKRTRKELYDHIQKWYPDSIALTSTHAKFVLIYNDDFNFVIETSANLNKNNRLESFRITENKEYCDFFRQTFNDIYSKARGNGGVTAINKVYG
jgi:hypothetical protein